MTGTGSWIGVGVVVVWLLAGTAAAQQSATEAETPAAAPEADTATETEAETEAETATATEVETPTAEEPGPEVEFTIGGYVEANYTYALGQPSNGVVALRGFDNQHNTFTLANAVIFTRLEYDHVYADLAVQWGNTPTTYYLAEPTRAATGGTGPSDASTWRWLQTVYLGWRIPIDGQLTLAIEGGLFLSPIGFEAMSVSSNWNFSRSNLFYGCPFYHTGIHATLSIGEQWNVTLGVWNGWNTLLDNNDEKSLSIQADYADGTLSAHLLYFTGVERNAGYVGGRPWRHLFDAWIRDDVTDWLSLALHADAGFEPSSLGLASWEAVAAYVHVVPISWMAISLRGDFFRDDAPNDAMGNSQRIFWPTEWVSSATATLSFHPHEALNFYVEYRHDHAAGNSFYAGAVPVDMAMQPIFDAPSQDTLTIGAAAYLSEVAIGR